MCLPTFIKLDKREKIDAIDTVDTVDTVDAKSLLKIQLSL